MFSYVAAENLVRTDPAKDGEGFFIALFAKKDATFSGRSSKKETRTRTRKVQRKKLIVPIVHTDPFRLWLHACRLNRPRSKVKSRSDWNIG